MARLYPFKEPRTENRARYGEIRAQIRAGRLFMLAGDPPVPRSADQSFKKALGNALLVCDLYYRAGMEVKEICESLGLSTRQTYRLLKKGTGYLLASGWIVNAKTYARKLALRVMSEQSRLAARPEIVPLEV